MTNHISWRCYCCFHLNGGDLTMCGNCGLPREREIIDLRKKKLPTSASDAYGDTTKYRGEEHRDKTPFYTEGHLISSYDQTSSIPGSVFDGGSIRSGKEKVAMLPDRDMDGEISSKYLYAKGRATSSSPGRDYDGGKEKDPMRLYKDMEGLHSDYSSSKGRATSSSPGSGFHDKRLRGVGEKDAMLSDGGMDRRFHSRATSSSPGRDFDGESIRSGREKGAMLPDKDMEGEIPSKYSYQKGQATSSSPGRDYDGGKEKDPMRLYKDMEGRHSDYSSSKGRPTPSHKTSAELLGQRRRNSVETKAPSLSKGNYVVSEDKGKQSPMHIESARTSARATGPDKYGKDDYGKKTASDLRKDASNRKNLNEEQEQPSSKSSEKNRKKETKRNNAKSSFLDSSDEENEWQQCDYRSFAKI